MKARILACSTVIALAALTGCSSSQSAINRSLGQAEATRILTTDNKLDINIKSSANSKLENARALKEDGKIEEAQALAEQNEIHGYIAPLRTVPLSIYSIFPSKAAKSLYSMGINAGHTLGGRVAHPTR